MKVRFQDYPAGFVILSAVFNSVLYPPSMAHAAGKVEGCLSSRLSKKLSTLNPASIWNIPYPTTGAEALALISRLDHSVYGRAVMDMKPRANQLTEAEKEKLWRMANKLKWRHAERTSALRPASRRITMNTNKERRAFQSGGWDESPDPAPPFAIKISDPRPAGMPTGVYQLSSGNHAYFLRSAEDALKNKRSEPFEIVYQQVTADGRVVTQKGGYAAPDSSRGWDGRFEFQPDGKGGRQLVVTQGAMELPVNYRGIASKDARDLPEVSKDNSTRSRHVFTPLKWIPAKGGKRAQLVVRDQGSILNMKPSTEKRWIETDANGKLLHAHGYGENFVPDPADPRKMWVDPDGYTWRIFDMVTAETKVQNPDGTFRYIPSETRAVAYRMDPKNPSKIVPKGVKLPDGKPANTPVFLTSNYFPGRKGQERISASVNDAFDPRGKTVEKRVHQEDGTVKVATDGLSQHDPAVLNEGFNLALKRIPATVRYAFDTRGKAVEKRFIQEDGTIKVVTDNVPQNEPAVLNEGFNLVPKPVQIGDREYYLGTNSAGEYTSGGVPDGKKETQYGTYLWFRDKKDGPIGPYHPVLTADGKDLEDMTKELTQMYGLSWGIGRGQVFEDDFGRWWLKAHGVDVDLLAKDHPQFGYPLTADQFANDYRRHQLTIPISFVERNGQPAIQVDDPKVLQDLEEWRKRRAPAQPSSKILR